MKVGACFDLLVRWDRLASEDANLFSLQRRSAWIALFPSLVPSGVVQTSVLFFAVEVVGFSFQKIPMLVFPLPPLLWMQRCVLCATSPDCNINAKQSFLDTRLSLRDQLRDPSGLSPLAFRPVSGRVFSCRLPAQFSTRKTVGRHSIFPSTADPSPSSFQGRRVHSDPFFSLPAPNYYMFVSRSNFLTSSPFFLFSSKRGAGRSSLPLCAAKSTPAFLTR